MRELIAPDCRLGRERALRDEREGYRIAVGGVEGMREVGDIVRGTGAWDA